MISFKVLKKINCSMEKYVYKNIFKIRFLLNKSISNTSTWLMILNKFNEEVELNENTVNTKVNFSKHNFSKSKTTLQITFRFS